MLREIDFEQGLYLSFLYKLGITMWVLNQYNK